MIRTHLYGEITVTASGAPLLPMPLHLMATPVAGYVTGIAKFTTS